MQKVKVAPINGKEVVWERFDSISELIEVSKGRDFQGYWAKDHSSESSSYGDGLGEDLYMEESHKLALAGDNRYDEIWREVSSKVSDAMKLTTFATSNRSKMDVVGSSVNVARAMAGYPRAFSRRVPDRRPKKVIRIAYGLAVRWSYSVRERLHNGITILAIIDRLERAGYSVQLDLLLQSSYNDGSYSETGGFSFCEVALKSFSSPMNIRKFQFPMAAKASLFHLGCYWQHRSGSPYDSCEGRDIAYHNSGRSIESFRKLFRSHDTVLITNGMIDDGLHAYIDEHVGGDDIITLIQKYIEQEIELIACGK